MKPLVPFKNSADGGPGKVLQTRVNSILSWPLFIINQNSILSREGIELELFFIVGLYSFF